MRKAWISAALATALALLAGPLWAQQRAPTTDGPEAIQFAADRAIVIGLIINELVSNAGKYAYPERAGGSIWVRVSLQADKEAITISVHDEGVGLPPGFDPAASSALARGWSTRFQSNWAAN
jgi:two-component sensor histidine kinase